MHGTEFTGPATAARPGDRIHDCGRWVTLSPDMFTWAAEQVTALTLPLGAGRIVLRGTALTRPDWHIRRPICPRDRRPTMPRLTAYTEGVIRSTYASLTAPSGPGSPVALADLRDRTHGIDRDVLDRALLELAARRPDVALGSYAAAQVSPWDQAASITTPDGREFHYVTIMSLVAR